MLQSSTVACARCGPQRASGASRPALCRASVLAPCGSQRSFVSGLTSGRRVQPKHGSEQVVASFLGVGAPEAFLVGVVALVVFGPQGLAEAAKTVGTTLKSFQPTIQELSQVSNDLKSTIQNEMGLDEFQRDIDSIRNPLATPVKPLEPGPSTGTVDIETPDRATSGEGASGSASSPAPKTAAQAAEEDDADFAKKLEDSKKAAWGGQYPGELDSSDAAKPAPKKELNDMSMSELEAELAKRKALIAELSKDS